MSAPLRIGIVGGGFMAQAHTMGLRDLRAVYGEDAPSVELVRIADLDADLARAAASRHGWAEATDDWTEVTRANDIDAVSVVTPNAAHAAPAIDALSHGKHVLCEKPLAADLSSAEQMAAAARASSSVSQVNFVYRQWPATATARRLIEEGAIGRVLHYRGYHFHDYALDREMPATWRFSRREAGAGSLGDLGSHAVDAARYLVGSEVKTVAAQSRTVIGTRPLGPGGPPSVDVDVDDSTDLLLEFEDGTPATVQVSWVATGRKTDWGFEVVGDEGSLRFGWQHANELRFYSHADPADRRGERVVIIGPDHPNAESFYGIAGPGLGYADAFTIALHNFVRAAGSGEAASPDFDDGLRVAQVLAAAQLAADERRWVELG
jgi:levoglucosan dehydrogenase